MMDPAIANPVRLVVVDRVYYAGNGDTLPWESGSAQWLKSEEQPYGPRHQKASEAWQALDTGWISESSMLVIANDEGKDLQIQPTLEEQVAIGNRILEVGINHQGTVTPFAFIAPGISMRLPPMSLGDYRVRSRSGVARFTFTAFPV